MDVPGPRQYSTYRYLTPLSSPIGTQDLPVASYFSHGSSFMVLVSSNFSLRVHLAGYIQPLARCLDTFDGDTNSAQWGVYYVKDIMFDANLAMVPRVPIHRSGNGKMTRKVTDKLAMYTTAYGLCDIALRLQGIPNELSSTPTLRHRRQPGWIGSNTCINGLRDVKVVLHTFLRKGEALETSTEVARPPIREDPCYVLANHVASAGAAKKAMTILRNISLIGFCISTMKRIFPEDIAQLAPTDQKIADQTYENLRLLVADSKRKRHVLQLAVCISPLVAFLPVDLVKQSVCPEELLINHRRFGTERPSKLRSIEDDIWGELFQLSDGVKTPSQVFVSCSQKADAWLKECALDPATCTFYGQGELGMPC
ncbi:hypothetical protein BKA70DRAFT_1440991 [Coprinopsis sp. MPI-PUGE-AT-0042]|nr:hypothetical protein BKA70DRAFT_1440991 [Coprinopsis sp. MPI-PUGE-AT-0042]